jgi:DNA-binding transcriptional LysR family regulator
MNAAVEIPHVKAVLAVASDLHFGKAAARLNIAPPALSRTIQHLETTLGVQLFERTSRNVQLTAAGRIFREYAAKALQALDHAVQSARRRSSCRSHIG